METGSTAESCSGKEGGRDVTAHIIFKGKNVDRAALAVHLRSKRPSHSILKRPGSASSCRSPAAACPAELVVAPSNTALVPQGVAVALHDSASSNRSSVASGSSTISALRTHADADNQSNTASQPADSSVVQHPQRRPLLPPPPPQQQPQEQQGEQPRPFLVQRPGPSYSGSSNWISPATAAPLTRNPNSWTSGIGGADSSVGSPEAAAGLPPPAAAVLSAVPSRLGGAARASRYLVTNAAVSVNGGAIAGRAPVAGEEYRRQYASWSGIETGATSGNLSRHPHALAGGGGSAGSRAASSGAIATAMTTTVRSNAAAGLDAAAVAAAAAGQLPGAPSRCSQELPTAGAAAIAAAAIAAAAIAAAAGGGSQSANGSPNQNKRQLIAAPAAPDRAFSFDEGGGVHGVADDGGVCTDRGGRAGRQRAERVGGVKRGRLASVDAAAYAAVLPDHMEELYLETLGVGDAVGRDGSPAGGGAAAGAACSAGIPADGGRGDSGGGRADVESLALYMDLPKMRLRARSMASALAAEVDYAQAQGWQSSSSSGAASGRAQPRRSKSDSSALTGASATTNRAAAAAAGSRFGNKRSSGSGRWLHGVRLLMHMLFSQGGGGGGGDRGGGVVDGGGDVSGRPAAERGDADADAAAEAESAGRASPQPQPPQDGSGGATKAHTKAHTRAHAGRAFSPVLMYKRWRRARGGLAPRDSRVAKGRNAAGTVASAGTDDGSDDDAGDFGGGAPAASLVGRSRDSVVLYRKRLGMDGERPVGLLRYLASASAAGAAACAPSPKSTGGGGGARRSKNGHVPPAGDAKAAAAGEWVELEALGTPQPLYQLGHRSQAVMRESRAAEALATGLTALRASVAVMEMESVRLSDVEAGGRGAASAGDGGGQEAAAPAREAMVLQDVP